MAEFKGIDVSKWQGNIDFAKVKSSGIDFVMIRCGSGYNSKSNKDPYFEKNYKNAKAAGLKVGVYFYSYAHSEAAAKHEALWTLEIIKGKQFEYPICFDMEESSVAKLGKTQVSKIARAYCDEIETAGYYAMIYTSKAWATSYFTEDIFNDFDIWIAQWNSKCTWGGNYGIWQYSDAGKVNGINGNVDMDISYRDFASMMKNNGLNGFSKKKVTNTSTVTKPPKTTVKTPKQGDSVTLKNAKFYASATTATAQKKTLTGTYYLYDGIKINGRYRVTKLKSFCGKKPIGMFVTGWVKI